MDVRDYIDQRIREMYAEALDRNTCPKCGMVGYLDGVIRSDGSHDGSPWCGLCGHRPCRSLTLRQ
jgi:hypothetical protein